MRIQMILVLCICLFGIQAYIHFTPYVWSKTRYLLQHPGTTPVMKEAIHLQMFEAYKEWSKYYATKKFGRQIQKGEIHQEDVEMYALIGLWKAIDKYDASYPFCTYATQCIHWSVKKKCTKNAYVKNACTLI